MEDVQCSHCGHWLTEDELKNADTWQESQKFHDSDGEVALVNYITHYEFTCSECHKHAEWPVPGLDA